MHDAMNHGQPWGSPLPETAVLEGKGGQDRGVPYRGQAPAQRRAGERGDARGASVAQHPCFVTLAFLRVGRLLEAPGLRLPGRRPAPSPGLRGLTELPEAPSPQQGTQLRGGRERCPDVLRVFRKR